MGQKEIKKTIGDALLFYGDCRYILKELEENSIYCCVTSPPYYGLRDYKVDGQIGAEKKYQDYVNDLVNIFRELKRVLRDDGSLWLNLGDTYSNKQLLGIPWRVALALQDDGWLLRSDIIWNKPNAMPQSVKDRPSICHEYLFLLTKSNKYYYDKDSILEPIKPETANRYSYGFGNPKKKKSIVETGKWHTGKNGRHNLCGDIPLNHNGRNKRSVWTVPTKPYAGAHFATFPAKLIEPCILASSPKGGVVIDIFAGSGTTGEVTLLNQRKFIGIELNHEYFKNILCKRVEAVQQQTRLNI